MLVAIDFVWVQKSVKTIKSGSVSKSRTQMGVGYAWFILVRNTVAISIA